MQTVPDCHFLTQAELRLDHSHLLTAQCTNSGEKLIAGLLLMWCLADEAQIIELAVHPDLRRKGIALALMTEALAEGSRFVAAHPADQAVSKARLHQC